MAQNNQTSGTTETIPRYAFLWTIISIIGFAGMFICFGPAEKSETMKSVLNYFAVLGHLALLPVVASLPAPSWAKVGGYSWAIFDTILAIATLNGIDDNTTYPLRLGLHTVVAAWPLGVGLMNKGFIRWAACAFALTMGVVPLLANAVPPKLIFIAGPFIFIFLGTVAWKLKKGKFNK